MRREMRAGVRYTSLVVMRVPRGLGWRLFASALILCAVPAWAGVADYDIEVELDPMERLLYHFNQQQAWVMRGTMPGGERSNGLAVAVKAQDGLPLKLLAMSMQSGLIAAQQDLAEVRWPWIDDDSLAALPLDQQLSIELGRRLVPQ